MGTQSPAPVIASEAKLLPIVLLRAKRGGAGVGTQSPAPVIASEAKLLPIVSLRAKRRGAGVGTQSPAHCVIASEAKQSPDHSYGCLPSTVHRPLSTVEGIASSLRSSQ